MKVIGGKLFRNKVHMAYYHYTIYTLTVAE